MTPFLKRWIQTVVLFIIGLYIYLLISYFGMEQFIASNSLKSYMNSHLWHVEIWISGIFFGTLFLFINRITESRAFRRRSYGFNLLIKSIFYLAALILVGISIYFIFLFAGWTTVEQLETYKSLANTQFLVSILVYFGIFIILMNFLELLNIKLGKGTFWEMLIGKYYHPHEEDLLFLFMDLKGSTRHAERMGHALYSRFLKDAIHELTPFIQKYHARVYQYVGDEVVLYWRTNNALSEFQAFNTFFEFADMLNYRRAYFIENYNTVPEFKAGIDAGKVTTTEIGDIKRELAFHGDVLNTASRLEKMCNEHKARLLITEHVRELIATQSNYQINFVSDMPLAGKAEKVKFYAVMTA